MKFRVKARARPKSIGRMVSSENLSLALDYIMSKQIRKLLHITLGATIKSKFLNGPLHLVVEPTSLCNARCALCSTPSEKLERSLKFLPLNKYKEIIDKTKSYVRNVTFFVAGEPFVNVNLCKMIDYATRNGLRTFISTNGTLLNRQTISEILETNLDELYICLDGARKESHEIYKKGTNFELICSNIRALTLEKRIRKKRFPYTFIQTLITRYNEYELDDVVKLGKKLGVDGVFFKTFCIEKGYNEDLAKKFIPRRRRLSRYEVVNGKVKLQEERDLKCGYTRTALVLCDGRLALCCYDFNGEYDIGNAFSESIDELWKSEKYKDLRKKMKRKEFEMCKEMCGAEAKRASRRILDTQERLGIT